MRTQMHHMQSAANGYFQDQQIHLNHVNNSSYRVKLRDFNYKMGLSI